MKNSIENKMLLQGSDSFILYWASVHFVIDDGPCDKLSATDLICTLVISLEYTL